MLGTEGRTVQDFSRKDVANPEQFGEAVLVVSYSCICCAKSESEMCLFSLTPDMLPE